MASTKVPLISPETYFKHIPARITTGDESGDTRKEAMGLGNYHWLCRRWRRFGFTENGSLTYVNTGNPCLDFFFHIVPSTPPESVIERLQEAWSFDPLTTLKLVCNLRGIRGTGKSDKERFYVAALWLHGNHPKTLACNVRVFAEFGYYKDLLEILYRLLEGEEVREVTKGEWEANKKGKGRERRMHFLRRRRRNRCNKEEKRKNGKVTLYDSLPSDSKSAQIVSTTILQKEDARALRKKKNFNKAIRAYERYCTDPLYRFLHDCIADMFAEDLKKDMKLLNSGEVRKISLASKWCPTIDSSYDKATLICESIARRVFPRESYPEYEGIEEAHYAYRVRDRLRKEVLVPLHKVLQLPEVYMSSNQWDTLPYNRVPSLAMKNYKNHFLRHDNKRFRSYLEDVKKGNATIAAGALLPHEIIASLNDSDGGKVAELQWARMVEDMKKIGKLNNCIAVCDVSGSMSGTPMEVSVALGLLISELSEDPWKGKVITFSESPELHLIQGDSLLSKTEFVRGMHWGANTDFQKVFDNILQVAIDGRLAEDQMIKRVFVFSDMEFDEASGDYGPSYWHNYYRSMSESDKPKGWETDYEVIERKFREKGFNHVPEIVFWNLRDSAATPVPSNQKGVALVSGFSKNMAKLFLENGGIIDPVSVMEKAISGELYQQLSVYD